MGKGSVLGGPRDQGCSTTTSRRAFVTAIPSCAVGNLSFTTVLWVAAIALVAPLLVLLAPQLRIPAVVLEILLGIVVGPSGLDWVRVDVPVNVLAVLGLGFLLFLAGLEIDPARLRHGIGRILLAFVISLGLAAVIGWGIDAYGETDAPLFIAITLASTSLGLVVPVMRDAGETDTDFGQLVMTASSVAEFGSIVLVSLFFSQNSSSTESTVFLLAVFAVLAVVLGLALSRAGRSIRVSGTLLKLEDTTAQIGVRVAIVLLAIFAALAGELGLETILGAFVAGALLRIVDRDQKVVHEQFRAKIEAIGYGFLIPVFFVASGLRFDADALFQDTRHVLLVPMFLAAIFVVRALPALIYRPLMGARYAAVAGLLQATTLTFPVVAAHLGVQLEIFDTATSAALIGAALLSVIIFPPIALRLLAKAGQSGAGGTAATA
jgi:Kef-type K+ transport system membrane component KefB